MTSEVRPRSATLASVLAVGEFRVLWLAYGQSRAGDQLARVALAILVFGQTDSPLWTALTYALTFLPPLVTAPLLTGLADRWPRRSIMVGCDLVRALLYGVMAMPNLSVTAVAVLLVLALSVQPLDSAARNAVLPNILSGDRYVVGLGVVTMTESVAQVAGFGLGGLLVGVIGPYAALGLNALTFAVSALLIRCGLREHRANAGDSAELAQAEPAHRSWTAGITVLWRNPGLRSLLLLIWLYGFYIAPEGVAAPYADELGQGSLAVGLLMAADPIGAGLGAYAFTRWVSPGTRLRIIGPLAVLAGVPLILSAVYPWMPLAIVMWTISGVLSTHVTLAHATFVQNVPDNRRGRAVGLMSAGLQAVQGIGVLAAGTVAEFVPASLTVGGFGLAGAVCAVWAGLSWHRARVGTTWQ